jgi:uncharacterized protein YuzE
MPIDVEIAESTGEVVAVYFYIRAGNSVETIEFAAGQALADYDRNGNLLGIELLGPCKVTILDKISRQEPGPIRRFLRNSIPNAFALAH